MSDELTIDKYDGSDAAKELLIQLAETARQMGDSGTVRLEVLVNEDAEEKRRTDQQRKAIEVYCRDLAQALNDAGWDQRAVLAAMREGVELPWSQPRAKDVLWREVQQAMLGKESTTKLDPKEVSRVYETLNRWTSSTLGVGVPFPSLEDQRIRSMTS